MKLISLVLVFCMQNFHILRYPFEHRSLFEDEGGKGYSGQIRAGSQLRDDV